VRATVTDGLANRLHMIVVGTVSTTGTSGSRHELVHIDQRRDVSRLRRSSMILVDNRHADRYGGSASHNSG